MDLTTWQQIGPYRILRILGRGGFASVYEVEHMNLGVHYALKAFILRGEGADQLLRRFEAEGRALARLNHKNLVRVIDLGVDSATGLPYYVMDLILGAKGDPCTLADVPPGSVEESQLSSWFSDVCAAVAYIHSQGIIHRDIKLNNVLVAGDGRLVLSDFGISRFLNSDFREQIDISLTRTLDQTNAHVMGTAAYMAPELLKGVPASVASDVYALGVMFFKLLTNIWYDPALESSSEKKPGLGFDSEDLLDIFDFQWRAVLPKMMAENPRERPQDVAHLPHLIIPVRRLPVKRYSLLMITGFVVFGLIGLVWWLMRVWPIEDKSESVVPMKLFDEAFSAFPLFEEVGK